VFLSTAAADSDAARAWLQAYGAALEKPESGSREGRNYLAGIDPALGPVVLLAGERGIAGARSSPDAAGIWELLMKLSPLAGPPAAGKR
jgi:hypothetical protein